jgi:hypothetical protein
MRSTLEQSTPRLGARIEAFLPHMSYSVRYDLARESPLHKSA